MKKFAKVLVENYLKILVSLRLKFRYKGKIIGIGGCFGKSSAVALVESMLKVDHKILSTFSAGKGLNSSTGIPLAIMDIKVNNYNLFSWVKYMFKSFTSLFKKMDQNYLILEMGVDLPGDMKFLASFIKPDVGILINSSNTHAAYFEPITKQTKKDFEELIAYENGYLLEASKEAILYNLDDPQVIQQISRFSGQTRIPFSSYSNSSIAKFQPSLSGHLIEFEYKGKRVEITYPNPLLEEYLSTFEMLIKLADYLDIPLDSLKKGILGYTLPPGRCTLLPSKNKSRILDSSYNSALIPTSSAIELVKKIAEKRRIAILGDMRELGSLTEKEHQKLALIAAQNLDIVITVGPAMKKYFAPEFEANKKENQVIYSFEKTKEALEFIKKENFEFIKPDDVILVKGSQNTLLLEIIVEAILQNPEDAAKLCRRDSHYAKERRKLLKEN